MIALFGSKGRKKGQLLSYATVIIFLFVFGFTMILGALFMSEFIDGWTTAGIYTGPVQVAGDQFFGVFQLMDMIIVLIMIVLLIGVGITSFRLNTRAAFFIVTFILGPFLGFMSYFFNYLFIEIVSQPVFATVLAIFPRTILICTNLHWVALSAIVIGSVTLYAKRPKEGIAEVEIEG